MKNREKNLKSSSKLQDSNEIKPLPFKALFRFATPGEKLLYIPTFLFSIAIGVGLPMMSFVWGDITNVLSGA